MNRVQTLQKYSPEAKKWNISWDLIYSLLLLVAFGACLLLGVIPQYESYLALLILLCSAASFFSDFCYLYLALYMFIRNRTIISTTPAFEFYAYMMLVKVILDIGKIKIRTFYLPAISVLLLHTLLAATRVDLEVALKVSVHLAVMYFSLSKILADDALFRKFLTVFLLGAIVSGVYGYVAEDVIYEMNAASGGVHEITQNYGILAHPSFAAINYNVAIFITLFLRKIPGVLRVGLLAFFAFLLLQTANLAGLITCGLCMVVAIVLRFRKKSVFILLAAVFACVLLLSVPRIRKIEAISAILLRVSDIIYYLKIGRWDMITTGRTDLWLRAIEIFEKKNLLAKLFGGSVMTMNITETMITTFFNSSHQSILQGLVNFGIIGTLTIYLPVCATCFYRVLRHLLRPAGYENQDIKMLQILLACVVISMSMTGDLFSDWACLLFMFI